MPEKGKPQDVLKKNKTSKKQPIVRLLAMII